MHKCTFLQLLRRACYQAINSSFPELTCVELSDRARGPQFAAATAPILELEHMKDVVLMGRVARAGERGQDGELGMEVPTSAENR